MASRLPAALRRKLRAPRYAVAHWAQGWRVTAGPFSSLKTALAVEPGPPDSVVLLLKGSGASATPLYGYADSGWRSLVPDLLEEP